MNEKEYMKMMYGIREEYIEEAIAWDGAERRRGRLIHRMTMSVGAIAAAIAVTIGIIAYNARDKHDLLPADSNLEEQNLNLLGGHGSIQPYLSTDGEMFFRDDDCWYHNAEKWSVNGGLITSICDIPNCKHDAGADCAISRNFSFETGNQLLTDGEQLFAAHQNTLYLTDSYGKESPFFTYNTDQNGQPVPADAIAIAAIQHLGGDCYLITVNDSRSPAFAMGENSAASGELQDAARSTYGKTADGVLSSLPPYAPHTVLFNAKDQSVNDYTGSADIKPDGSGEGFYALTSQPDQIHMLHYRFDDLEHPETYFSTLPDQPNTEIDYRIVQWKWTEDSGLFYETDTHDLAMHDTHNTVANFAANGNAASYGYSYMDPYSDGSMYCIVYESGADQKDLTLYDTSDGLAENRVLYAARMETLWGSDFPNEAERPELHLLRTDDTVMFLLPKTGLNGEEYVICNTESGEVKYAGHHVSGDFEDAVQTSVSVVSGTATGTATGTTGTGTTATTASANADTTAATVSETTASATNTVTTAPAENIRAEETNVLGGVGAIRFVSSRTELFDDRYMYYIEAGKRGLLGDNITFTERICHRDGCSHSDDSCVEYRLKNLSLNGEIMTDQHHMYHIYRNQLSVMDPETLQFRTFYTFPDNGMIHNIESFRNPATGQYDKCFIYSFDNNSSAHFTIIDINTGAATEPVTPQSPDTPDIPDWMLAKPDQTGGRYIWTCCSDAVTLIRLDPFTGETAEFHLPDGMRLSSLGYANTPNWYPADNLIWFVDGQSGAWYCYHPETNSARAIAPSDAVIAERAGAADITPCGEKVFAYNFTTGEIIAGNHEWTDIISGNVGSNATFGFGSLPAEISCYNGVYYGWTANPAAPESSSAIFFTLAQDRVFHFSTVHYD
ncbi:MAG TPA: hypothetical protein DCG49_03935 [Ruminococcus sp.]|nr:hypothetical protein [Ruminococcus sp.]